MFRRKKKYVFSNILLSDEFFIVVKFGRKGFQFDVRSEVKRVLRGRPQRGTQLCAGRRRCCVTSELCHYLAVNIEMFLPETFRNMRRHFVLMACEPGQLGAESENESF